MVCQYMLSSDNNVTQFISNLDKYIEKFNEVCWNHESRIHRLVFLEG